jgi:2,3-bisphosphoglycerate-dependent phosphoglycerate mutase
MRLYCLRHGLTIENTKGIYHGTSDGTLTDEQRAALANVRFDASRYDAIYCSPLGRCAETARALGIQSWVTDARITERNFGIFEGLSRSECEARFPDEFRAFQRFDEHYQIPKGESRAQNLARVLEWIQAIRRHQQVLAITHGGTIDFLYRMARGMDLHGGSEIFSASNASLSSFNVDWPQVELVAYDARLVA